MNDDLMNFDDVEFASNPDDRCAVSIIIDESGSMGVEREGHGVPIEELNNSLDLLVSSLHSDPLSRRRCEISFCTYSTEVNNLTDFKTVDNLVLPTLQANGLTSSGKAINTALDKLEERKKSYRENGISTYRSIVLFLTDGVQTDDVSDAAKRVAELESRKSIVFFPVGISGYDPEGLKQICPPGKEPLGLNGLKFDELFQWLSSSIASVSSSQIGDKVSLPSPAGWMEM